MRASTRTRRRTKISTSMIRAYARDSYARSIWYWWWVTLCNCGSNWDPTDQLIRLSLPPPQAQLLITFGFVCVFTFSKGTQDWCQENPWLIWIALVSSSCQRLRFQVYYMLCSSFAGCAHRDHDCHGMLWGRATQDANEFHLSVPLHIGRILLARHNCRPVQGQWGYHGCGHHGGGLSWPHAVRAADQMGLYHVRWRIGCLPDCVRHIRYHCHLHSRPDSCHHLCLAGRAALLRVSDLRYAADAGWQSQVRHQSRGVYLCCTQSLLGHRKHLHVHPEPHRSGAQLDAVSRFRFFLPLPPTQSTVSICSSRNIFIII